MRISKCSPAKSSGRDCACLSLDTLSTCKTGHLVYSFLGNLMAVRFNPEERAIDGVPMVVAKGMQTFGGFGALGRSGFSVSRTGTLVWLRAGAQDAGSRLVRVERDGKVSPLSALQDVLQTPRLSPDGRRLAVVVRSGIMTREIRVLDAARPDRIICDDSRRRQPVACVDGQPSPDLRLEPRWASEDLRCIGGWKKASSAAVSPRMQLPRVTLQAGRGRRVCWASTRSSRPAGATYWCIAPENR